MTDLKVLIADDSMFMRSTIKKALAKIGVTNTIEAGDGTTAVELYRENQPGLCILDITMPEKSGMEALKEIKEINPEAVIIMCSAIGQEAIVMECIKGGAAEFIVKPFQEDKIIEVVQNYL